MTSVDVVVPSYNYARFLPRCIDSLLKQTDVDVRVLIIDDCSSDETPQMAEKLVAGDARVHYRRHVRNLGHIATYNEGLLEWARADYSLLISADDLLAPQALATATRLLNANPDMGLCYGQVQIIFDDDDPPASTGAPNEPLPERVVSSSAFLRRCFLHGNPVPTPTAVVRTAIQQRIGGYKAELPHSGDFEMWMRFAVDGPIGIIGGVLGYYRKHQSSMSVQYYSRLLSDRAEVIAACDEVLRGRAERFPEATSWRSAMLERLANDAFWAADQAFADGHADKVSACLQFARATYPPITGSKWWRRLQMKRLLGRRLTDVIGRLRGGEAPPTAPSSIVAETHLGWWPVEDSCDS